MGRQAAIDVVGVRERKNLLFLHPRLDRLQKDLMGVELSVEAEAIDPLAEGRGLGFPRAGFRLLADDAEHGGQLPAGRVQSAIVAVHDGHRRIGIDPPIAGRFDEGYKPDTFNTVYKG